VQKHPLLAGGFGRYEGLTLRMIDDARAALLEADWTTEGYMLVVSGADYRRLQADLAAGVGCWRGIDVVKSVTHFPFSLDGGP